MGDFGYEFNSVVDEDLRAYKIVIREDLSVWCPKYKKIGKEYCFNFAEIKFKNNKISEKK